MAILKLEETTSSARQKEEVIRESLKFVRRIAGKYRALCYATGIDLEDLISEGTIGLLLAYKRFDPRRGGFYSYAYPYIKGHIVDYIRDKAAIIRLPQKTNRLIHQIFQEDMKNKSPEKVAESLGIRPDRATKILQFTRLKEIKSLNQHVKFGIEKPGVELIDLIKCEDDMSEIIVEQFIQTLEPGETTMLKYLMDGLKLFEIARRMLCTCKDITNMLSEVQKKAAIYFGLDKGSEGTLLQKKFNVTKEQYQELRLKGYTDARIAKQFGMGDSALYRRKKEWGLVETKNSEEKFSDSDMKRDEEVRSLNSRIKELEIKISRLKTENGLLWDMVRILKEEQI